MNTNLIRANRCRIAAATLAILLTAAITKPARADDKPDAPAPPVERQKIMDLCDKGNFLDALPGLRELHQRDSEDHLVSEDLALALLMSSHDADNEEKQKAKRIEARNILLDAQKHGDKSNLTLVLLEQLPEDGSIQPFSDRKEVNDAMQLGELEFARGQIENAIKFYQQAYKLDPKLYVAALFTGDMYFRLNKQIEAGEWFNRAIKIDPNAETAYRYWGDALMKDGKTDEAKDKFIGSIVANPYRSASWVGLSQWAHKTGATLDLPKWKPAADDADNKTDAVISKTYHATRDDWKSDQFKKEFPKEAKYRHTLKEETQALSAALDALEKIPKADRGELSPQTDLLLRIKQAGMLEPYILLALADEGIAQDYPAYRDANREKLQQFIKQFVIGKDNEEH